MSETLIKAFDRLTSEVANLRRDTMRLHSRVDPDWKGNEPDYLTLDRFPSHLGKAKPTTEQEVWDLIKLLRSQVHGADYHLSAIRSYMDDICRDAISREEMKPYLKSR